MADCVWICAAMDVGRAQESVSEDPYLNSLYAARFVRGLQGDVSYSDETAAARRKKIPPPLGPIDSDGGIDSTAGAAEGQGEGAVEGRPLLAAATCKHLAVCVCLLCLLCASPHIRYPDTDRMI
jgi:hypothetical protein